MGGYCPECGNTICICDDIKIFYAEKNKMNCIYEALEAVQEIAEEGYLTSAEIVRLEKVKGGKK